MDFFLNNEKKKRFNSESRWNRIEKKHIHSIHRNDAASEICKNLLKNKDFIKERQMKALMGEDTIQWSLDPNRVMDLRHFSVRKPKKYRSLEQSNKIRTKNDPDDREQFHRMLELNREIDKFKEELENIRPKTTDIVETNRTFSSGKLTKNEKKVKLVIPNTYSRCATSDLAEIGHDSGIESELKDYSTFEVTESKKFKDFLDVESNPKIIVSDDETDHTMPKVTIPKETKQKTEVHLLQPNRKTNIENLELVITPSFSFDIQETRSNISIESSCEDTARESKISLDQHMSILIRNLHFGNNNDHPGAIIVNESFVNNSPLDVNKSTERENIIDDLFRRPNGNNFIILQKYFLRWVHFTTIERLIRRNPDQTRLQKMQMFLQNITVERKKSLAKLRLNTIKNNEPKKVYPHQVESPRLLMRKYNTKIRTQQDIIELQKMKLQRQERVIAELKLSKLFEDMNEAENHLKEELKFVARNGCQNSRSKARCLQIVGKLKDQEDDERYLNLQAKGLSAPKFLIEMQARALEREMRHQQAQQRRENLEREREAMRIAAEEEKRLQDEETKRQRIRDLKRKRKEEKELEMKRALERMKYLADLEKAKHFNRYRQLQRGVEKLKNLIHWKRRNEQVSNTFRRRHICRIWFNRWRKFTRNVWCERKSKADECYRLHCLRIGWSILQSFYLVEHSKKLLANDWYELRLSERMFRTWHCKMIYRRMTFEVKQKQAEAQYNWHLKWKVLEHWRHLHAILQIEKETEARRERWRSKIHELVPDYTPNTLEFL